MVPALPRHTRSAGVSTVMSSQAGKLWRTWANTANLAQLRADPAAALEGHVDALTAGQVKPGHHAHRRQRAKRTLEAQQVQASLPLGIQHLQVLEPGGLLQPGLAGTAPAQLPHTAQQVPIAAQVRRLLPFQLLHQDRDSAGPGRLVQQVQQLIHEAPAQWHPPGPSPAAPHC